MVSGQHSEFIIFSALSLLVECRRGIRPVETCAIYPQRFFPGTTGRRKLTANKTKDERRGISK